MTLNEYQKKALETAQYRREYNIIYPTLGLTGEAGEVSDKKGTTRPQRRFLRKHKMRIGKGTRRCALVYRYPLT